MVEADIIVKGVSLVLKGDPCPFGRHPSVKSVSWAFSELPSG
jgi:hypothetical protein